MQKLIWQNANGDSVDLTRDPYGITSWEGFSSAELNIQTQKVPFCDGDVFLDALLEQRELSVTLAMNAKNDLEKRYRLRRELIKILNPKLGEGYLIYSNDYTEKRIKCVPQIPLFQNCNSNDSGSPKASLAWTACDPYWEDLEEILVPLKIGVRKTITNNGDVPCALDIHLFSDDVTNPQIRSFTEDKLIKLNGSYNSNININTNFGQKSVSTENIEFELNNLVSDLWSVTYSEYLGLFVAVGDSQKIGGSVKGIILTSPDAINWIFRNVNVSAILRSIVYSESLGLFVAVGSSGTILTSSDAINWTSRTSGTTNGLLSVAFSEPLGLFVAVGADGTILTSPDAVDWTSRTSDVSVTLNTIVYSETLNLFVIGGNSGTILTSPGGTNWTLQVSGVSTNLLSVVYSESLGLFVAVGFVVGEETVILTSSNGVGWISRDSGLSGDALRSVTYSESLGLFVAVGQIYSHSRGIILTSPDAINWTSLTVSPVSYSLYFITYSEPLGLFLGVGLSSETFTSTDGTNWIYKNFALTAREITSIAYSESLGLFVAVGGGTVLTSPDAINWVLNSSILPDYFVGYFEERGIFIMTGKESYYGYETILTSPDGINWTTVWTADARFTLRSVTYSESLGLFVAVGGAGRIFTSPDAINWTSQISGTEYYYLNSVAYSESLGLFVVVGTTPSSSSGIILTSTDAINWEMSDTMPTIFSVIYAENKFVVVGSGRILISSDGINWSEVIFNANLRSVIFSKPLGLFVAVGNNGGIIFSPDAINWINLTSGVVVDLNSIAYSESLNQFVVVGDDGAILDSTFTSVQNLIADLTADSDMTLSLDIGENVLLIGKSSGNLNGAVRYRQKYIGV